MKALLGLSRGYITGRIDFEYRICSASVPDINFKNFAYGLDMYEERNSCSCFLQGLVNIDIPLILTTAI